MKKLIIIGMGGYLLANCLVDVTGQDFTTKFQLPLFLPVVSISLTELSDEDNERIKSEQEKYKRMVSP